MGMCFQAAADGVVYTSGIEAYTLGARGRVLAFHHVLLVLFCVAASYNVSTNDWCVPPHGVLTYCLGEALTACRLVPLNVYTAVRLTVLRGRLLLWSWLMVRDWSVTLPSGVAAASFSGSMLLLDIYCLHVLANKSVSSGGQNSRNKSPQANH